MSKRRVVRRAVLAAGGSLAALAGYDGIASYVRSQIFQPDPAPVGALTTGGVTFDVLRITPGEDRSLTGLIARSRSPGRAVVLFLHGNSGNAEKGAREAAVLVGGGYDVVVADYRGYGANAGTPSEIGLVADADAFRDVATALAAGRPLLLVGHSLGGAVAILLAGRATVSGLLTIGAVARMADLVPAGGRPFLRDGFDALAASERIGIPWIIAHGEADAVVPAGDALRLAGARSRPGRELALFRDLGHEVDSATLLALVDRLFARVTAGLG